ncbi:hypothetical protein HG537_0D00770 [Torulaspora globosa]|uniref:Uncharacterized protein n=1 Tax=Torulaspora globosa TaxID=48254 RepID=A0A7H9HTN9_9SACH|nr:hypothetical protein HG537_0D00770 [Torulaspora sp. CBS 2947]
MRSFIKSHKKTNSLEESPTRIAVSPPRTGRRSDHKTSEDSLAFVPSTPTQLSHNNNGSKHSPSFESLHRLANKKMFSTKLFKKNSSSTTLAQVTTSSGSHHDISSITEASSRNSGSTLEATQFNGDEATIPSIKGTITHNWGDHSDKQQPVIILNNPSGGDSAFSQDLEPAVRITSLRRGSAISSVTIASYENALPRTMSADEQLQKRSEPTRDRHVYNELWKVKSKNRQARIHSHDDIIDLEKSSTVSLNLLESTISPLAPLENLEQPDTQEQSSDTQKRQALNDRALNEANHTSKKNYLGLSINLQNANDIETEKCDDSDTEEDDSSLLRTPDVDEEDDDTSKFSFEMSGLNGRTSSVKYYSKPDPKEAVYIDDVYDDEDFDEDMNFYGDDLQNNDFHLADETFIPASDIADGPGCLDLNAGKPLKRYNDLFDLSDDSEDSEYQHDTADESQESEAATNLTELPPSKPDDQENLNDKYGESHSNIDNAAGFRSKIRSSANKTTAKAIKSFSDIFDLDDSDEDESEEDSRWDDGFCNYDEAHNYIHDNEQSGHIISIDKDHQTGGLEDITKDISNHTGKDSSFSLPGRSDTPVQIFVTPPVDHSTDSAASAESQMSSGLTVPPPLPPPARSQTLKIHDLNSSLDSEVPGLMSNLYFIDEAEEDKYNERNGIAEDDYLDEINTVPEDFNFSDTEQELNSAKSPLRLSNRGSFRSTHSYSEQPIGAARESTPTRNKLEIKNKTVTFFNYRGDRSPVETSAQRSPQDTQGYLTSPNNNNEDYVISPIKKEGEACNPVTPTNSFKTPKPEYLNDYSLSPIQENSSSVDNSPSLQLQ